MSSRRRATLSPSLFPFLAVLVCTLGTLILFLALVAQKAEQTAQAAVADDPGAPESVDSLVAEQQWMRDRYVAIRESQTDDLKQRSSELTHIEDHLHRLRTKLQQLQDETVAAVAQGFDQEAKHQEIVLLKSEIEAEKQRLEGLQEEVASRRPRVVIVPHQGPNGTDQRPIYVECSADGVTVQPEGSFISNLQLEGPPGPGNPLDAALRTVRYHWQQSDPEGPDPYPLLVVRPDGIDSYAAARRAMQSWDDQFGYELIPGEIELAFPRADESLRANLDVAIREAVTRQHARLAAMSYARTRGSGGGTRPRVLSASDLARGGTFSGGGSDRHFSRPVTADTASRSGSIDGADIRDFDAALRGASSAPASASDNSGDISLLDPRGRSGSPNQQTSANPFAMSMPQDTDSATGERATGTGAEDPEGRLDGQSQGASSPGDAQNAVGATGGGQPSSTGQPQTPQQNQFAQENASPPPPSGSNQNAGTAGQPSKTLQRGGRDWALPDSARNRGTAIVRGLNVVCLRDAFLLMPETPGGQAQQFAFQDGFVERAAMQLATAVHDRVDSWGFAIAGGRWQPVLRVQVDRDAEQRFRQLRMLLQGSGLELEQR